MRNPAFCICETKPQIRCTKRLCFRFIENIIPLFSESEIKTLTIFCGCTARLESDLIGNSKDRFSRDTGHDLLNMRLIN